MYLILHPKVRLDLPSFAVQLHILHACLELHVRCVVAVDLLAFPLHVSDDNNRCCRAMHGLVSIPSNCMLPSSRGVYRCLFDIPLDRLLARCPDDVLLVLQRCDNLAAVESCIQQDAANMLEHAMRKLQEHPKDLFLGHAS